VGAALLLLVLLLFLQRTPTAPPPQQQQLETPAPQPLRRPFGALRASLPLDSHPGCCV
jgi:hypothetical protein